MKINMQRIKDQANSALSITMKISKSIYPIGCKKLIQK